MELFPLKLIVNIKLPHDCWAKICKMILKETHKTKKASRKNKTFLRVYCCFLLEFHEKRKYVPDKKKVENWSSCPERSCSFDCMYAVTTSHTFQMSGKCDRVSPSNAMNHLSWLCSKSCYVRLRTVLYCMHACLHPCARQQLDWCIICQMCVTCTEH